MKSKVLAIFIAAVFMGCGGRADNMTQSNFTTSDLMALDFERDDSGTLTYESEDFGVQIQTGRAGAKQYLDEIHDQLLVLADMEHEHETDSGESSQNFLRLSEELLEEATAVRELLNSDNWEEDMPQFKQNGQTAALTEAEYNSVCGMHYKMDYEIARTFYRFSLNVTTTVLANGVGPRPPYPQSGTIEAIAVTRPGPSPRDKDVQRLSFPDTWLQSHSVHASADSGLHGGTTMVPWKAVSKLIVNNEGCTGFSRILVWGRNSYQSPIVIDNIIKD